MTCRSRPLRPRVVDVSAVPEPNVEPNAEPNEANQAFSFTLDYYLLGFRLSSLIIVIVCNKVNTSRVLFGREANSERSKAGID